jgi:predicted O-methyltransferase YrrM
MVNEASVAFAENFAVEDEVITAARARARELGCVPIGPAGGATLRLLAAVSNAKAVVEIGTGAGVSGLRILEGMTDDGVLTSVDVEAENQRAAKEAYTEAGVAPSRYRLINGAAAEVLPRLQDSYYDMVFVDADKSEYELYYEQAVRLLRPGGVVAFDNALWHNAVADPAASDESTVTLRNLVHAVGADDRLIPVLLPVGDGLLVAAKR